jgi:hypothetical protein
MRKLCNISVCKRYSLTTDEMSLMSAKIKNYGLGFNLLKLFKPSHGHQLFLRVRSIAFPVELTQHYSL